MLWLILLVLEIGGFLWLLSFAAFIVLVTEVGVKSANSTAAPHGGILRRQKVCDCERSCDNKNQNGGGKTHSNYLNEYSGVHV